MLLFFTRGNQKSRLGLIIDPPSVRGYFLKLQPTLYTTSILQKFFSERISIIDSVIAKKYQ